MSYVVLARRYRPKKFDDLVGQEHVTETLKNALKTKRSSHAYLFTGPRGVGKTSAARLLAKALRCLNPGPDAEPCNECDSCKDLNSGNSLDVLEIDAASNTGVDSIRELREGVGFMPAVGSYKIYIIDEVHMLSTSAFNALLKTLEEPPPHVVFVFATTELHKVPATIQSRCQRFDFKRIPRDVMMNNLRDICRLENIVIDDGSLRTISVESEGCLRDAQSLLDQAIALCGKEILVEKLEKALGLVDRSGFFALGAAIGAHDAGLALKLVNEMMQKGVEPKILLGRLIQLLRDLHYRAFTGQYPVDDPDLKILLDAMNSQWGQDEIVRAMELCLRTQANLNQFVQVTIALESLVVRMCLQRSFGVVPTIVPDNPKPVAPATPVVGAMAGRSARVLPVSSDTAPIVVAKPVSAPVPNTGALKDMFEAYIRQNKPAWLPVLASVLNMDWVDKASGKVKVLAKADFAGRRLASKDGLEVVKTALKVSHVVVDLEQGSLAESQKSPQERVQEKRSMAKEHEAVKSALEIFGAKITETQIMDDER